MRKSDYKHRMDNIQEKSLNILISKEKITHNLSQIRIPNDSLQQKIDQARKDFNIILLTDHQKTLLNEILREMAGLLPFNVFVIRGFLLRAIRNWQILNNLVIAECIRMNRVDQFKVGIEILQLIRPYLNRALIMRDKRAKIQFIEEVIFQITEFYHELLSVQAFLNNPDNEEILLDLEIDVWLMENVDIFP
ncbi:MAG: hypothetical protein ACXAC8_15325 [Candidatus Hodarchaeales archaeon]